MINKSQIKHVILALSLLQCRARPIPHCKHICVHLVLMHYCFCDGGTPISSYCVFCSQISIVPGAQGYSLSSLCLPTGLLDLPAVSGPGRRTGLSDRVGGLGELRRRGGGDLESVGSLGRRAGDGDRDREDDV